MRHYIVEVILTKRLKETVGAEKKRLKRVTDAEKSRLKKVTDAEKKRELKLGIARNVKKILNIKKGKLEKAGLFFSKAIQIDPEFNEARRNLDILKQSLP